MDTLPCLLIVEDEPDLLEALSEYLDASGFAVLSAANAAVALEMAQTREPDAVLADLSLPDVRGDIFLQQFRTKHPKAQLFVHSGDSTFVPTAPLESLGLVQDHVFYKPADLSVVAAKLRQALRG